MSLFFSFLDIHPLKVWPTLGLSEEKAKMYFEGMGYLLDIKVHKHIYPIIQLLVFSFAFQCDKNTLIILYYVVLILGGKGTLKSHL